MGFLRALCPLCVLLATLACMSSPDPITAAGRELVWSDEFDRAGLPDPARWSYDVGGHGWGNKEMQFYTADRPENARVEGGHLIVEARRENWQGSAYTSARLVTKRKGDWTYARIEARARLPKGRGSWPAIWMLATTAGEMSWPDDGEIDLMEHVGFDQGVVHGSIHTKAYNHRIGTQKTANTRVADASDAFHVYAIEWDESRIRWFVDDREFFSFANERAGKDVWPFDGPFHLLVNLAVGGTWGGQKGVDDAAFPMRMELDYVRVYR
ncbi:MAG TPA: glycoside hydrolase family 16 protein [Vicinamibacterales bacterium]|jgi:beta-glucanase (GH16 family)|nr:glycoside hydrolase family 16 protein [Vicinamibacterales bacterium]